MYKVGGMSAGDEQKEHWEM